MKTFFCAAALASFAAVSAQDEGDHGHGSAEYAFEAGVQYSSLSTGSYSLVLGKVDGEYADPTMSVAVFAAGNSPFDVIYNEEFVEVGDHALEDLATCTDVQNGGVISPQSTTAEACYRLVFDTMLDENTYTINVESSSIAIFAEHGLTEFGATADHLVDSNGVMVAPSTSAPVIAAEWGGSYHLLEAGPYFFALGKEGGDYADATMRVSVFPLTDDAESTLNNAADEGLVNLNKYECPDVNDGDVLTVADGTCFNIVFDGTSFQTVLELDISGVEATESVGLFAQHFPSEFGEEADALIHVDGGLIEPDYMWPGDEEGDKPWGKVIGASIIVLLATFSCVVLFVPFVAKLREQYQDTFNACLFAFAAGAILSTAFYFILFEATHLVATGWDEEVDQVWRWGTMILFGFLMPMALEIVVRAAMGVPDDEGAPMSNVVVKDNNMQTKDLSGASGETEKKRVNPRVLAGVLFGDFMHNFVDGIIIGTAFSGCGTSTGWTVTAATVGHEIAQEIGDYCVLTGVGNLTVIEALAANFATGLSVLIGAIVILSQDVDQDTEGLILAFGGGAYIAIGATESMPRAIELAKTQMARGLAVLSFIVGSVCIGLVLLDHEHCVPGGGDHGH